MVGVERCYKVAASLLRLLTSLVSEFDFVFFLLCDLYFVFLLRITYLPLSPTNGKLLAADTCVLLMRCSCFLNRQEQLFIFRRCLGAKQVLNPELQGCGKCCGEALC